MIVEFVNLITDRDSNQPTFSAEDWTTGGAVNLNDIVAIGQFCPATHFSHSCFTIHFRGGSSMVADSNNATAMRKLHAVLTKLWISHTNV